MRSVIVTLLAFLVWLGSDITALGAILGGPIVNPANAHSYYILTEDIWTNSQSQAVALGGNLVTINNAEEQTWVFDTFGSFGGTNRSLWIGLTDQDVEGTFVWISGEPVTYTNWSPGEPSNYMNEDYVHMVKTGNGYGDPPEKWNDLKDGEWAEFDPIHGVVEVIPEPSTFIIWSLLGVLGISVGWWRRRKA